MKKQTRNESRRRGFRRRRRKTTDQPLRRDREIAFDTPPTVQSRTRHPRQINHLNEKKVLASTLKAIPPSTVLQKEPTETYPKETCIRAGAAVAPFGTRGTFAIP